MNKRFYGPDFKLGILGGGQLGRMFIQEAINLNLSVDILDPDPNAPCKEIATNFTVGDLKDFDTVLAFGRDKDIVTIEIEHVNVDALERLENDGVLVYPQASVLRVIQDKGLQKSFYKDNNIPTAAFHLVDDKEQIQDFLSKAPFMQKLRKGGYDGKGVTPIRSEKDIESAFDAPSVLEEFVDFKTEISVIVGRNPNGDLKAFPTVELSFNPEANLVEFLFSPGNISREVEEKAQALAKQVADAIGVVGILAVEMFVSKDDEVLVNEIAPRAHNSGHQSIEANITSQYAQHLRAIMNLPLGDTAIVQPSVMVNLLGDKEHTGEAYYQNLNEVLSWSGVYVHLYGKKVTKPFRKMGHVTVTRKSLDEAKALALKVKDTLKVISA
jgi:5-(carboxyamino)imidazole ribonucleotide synthase